MVDTSAFVRGRKPKQFGRQMRGWLSSWVPLGTFIRSAEASVAMCSVSTTRPTG